MRFTRTLTATILSVACSAALAEEAATPSSEPARLRLFGQNGVNVKYYPNSACRGGESVSVSGGIGDAFSSFIGAAKNKSIGMPASPNTENQSARDGMLSKAYYREYEVTPGQPITITMHFQSNPGKRYMYCTTVATSFVPEQGKNYEGTFEIQDGICLQVVNELQNTSEGTMLKPVAVTAAEACS